MRRAVAASTACCCGRGPGFGAGKVALPRKLAKRVFLPRLCPDISIDYAAGFDGNARHESRFVPASLAGAILDPGGAKDA